MYSFSEILELWPQLSELASDIGRPYATVVAWKRRDSIPLAYWPAVVASAKSRRLYGITKESLLGATGRIKPPSRNRNQDPAS